MGGLFGGLLGLVEDLGGLFLSWLIGREAWRDNGPAETARVITGGLLAGLGLGALSYTVYFAHADIRGDGEYVIPFAVIPLLTFVFAIFLLGLKRVIEK